MPVSFCRFVSVDLFLSVVLPAYGIPTISWGPLSNAATLSISFIYLFHLSLRQRFALIFMKEHLSQVVRCAPNFAYSDPDLDR